MVKEIKYIWYGMTFTELRETLRLNKKLRGFPLVDSPTQMVLLGSVQRTELITAIEKHIGKEKYVGSINLSCLSFVKLRVKHET